MFLLVLQIIVSLLLAGAILLQAKGTGLGSSWGIPATAWRTKRGAEKLLFSATIVLGTLFILLAIINLLV